MVFKVERYVCEECLKEYPTEEEATKCQSLWVENVLNVEGAIVDYFYDGIPDLYGNNDIFIPNMKVIDISLHGHCTRYALSEKIGENKWNTFPSFQIESTASFEKYCTVKENPNKNPFEIKENPNNPSDSFDETSW